MEDEKKKLIKEKITGRRITPARAAKLILLAAICGLIFGAASAYSSSLVRSHKTEKPAETTVVPESTTAEEKVPETLPEEGPETQAVPDNQLPEEEEPENLFVPGTSEYSKAILSMFRNAAEIADNYLVSINVTSQTATWFDMETVNVETYSGVVVSMDESEMLILTTCTETDGKTLKVVFQNGSIADAFVRQVSETDGLSLLAVSTTEGISEDTLATIVPVEFADTDELQNGDMILAVGAPMGVIGSFSYGHIGYIDRNESGIDCVQQVFYSEISSDSKKGTFVLDFDGRLVGVESDVDSAVSNGTNISRIIGAASIRKIVKALKTGRKRAYLGIRGQDVNFEMKYNNIPEGVYITEVVHDSPAYVAGLRRGDIIIKVDDKSITEMDMFMRVIDNSAPDDEMTITVKRDSVNNSYNDIDAYVVLGER